MKELAIGLAALFTLLSVRGIFTKQKVEISGFLGFVFFLLTAWGFGNLVTMVLGGGCK